MPRICVFTGSSNGRRPGYRTAAVSMGQALVARGFELVYGGINDIQGRAFGHLTLAIRGADAVIDAALARIAERVDVTEVP